MAEEVSRDDPQKGSSILESILGVAGKALDLAGATVEKTTSLGISVGMGIVDGATDVVGHGSAEAAAALFTGHGYVMYGQNHDSPSILESIIGNAQQVQNDLSNLDHNPERDRSNDRGRD